MEANKNNLGTNAPFSQSGGGFGGFSFSSSSTTPQSSPAKPSVFGATPSNIPQQGSLFGSTSNNVTGPTAQNTAPGNTAPASTSKSSLFGGTVSNSATGTNSPNIFNSFNNPKPAASSPSVSLNANTSNQTPQSTNPFGLKPQANSNNLFSNLSSNANSNSGSSVSNPSGNTTTTSTFSFGATPSANPPAKDAGAGQPPIFGGGTSKEASSQSAASPAANVNLFASKPSDSSNANKTTGPAGPTTTTTTTVTSSSSPFSPSLPSKPTGSLFGAAPASNTTVGFSIKTSTAPAKSSPLAMNSPTNIPPSGEANSSSNSTNTNTFKPTTGTPLATSSSTNNTSTTNINNNSSSSSSSKPSLNLAPSLLKGKTLEDLVSRWNSELDERVEDFKLTASEIAAWDQLLIQNGDQISGLYEELQRIDPIQSSIDQTLDYVETQQSELSAALEDYERQLNSQQAGGAVEMTMMTGGNNRIRTAGQEREEAYKTAEEVHAQLNDMVGSLGTMIAELNSLAGPGNRIDESSITDGSNFGSNSNSSMDDPIVQISGILNAHLSSLNWISEISNELSSKIIELESRVSNTKVELGLESNNLSKQTSDVDDFNHLSLGNNYNTNHNIHSTVMQGAGGMRHLSGSIASHPRR